MTKHKTAVRQLQSAVLSVVEAGIEIQKARRLFAKHEIDAPWPERKRRPGRPRKPKSSA